MMKEKLGKEHEELQSLLEREEDEETRKYIESLLKHNKRNTYDINELLEITRDNNKMYR